MSQVRTRTERAWLVPLGLAAVLAVLSVFTSAARAQWLVAVGGALAVAAIGRYGVHPNARRTGHRFPGRHPLALVAAGFWLTVLSELLHATGAGYPSYADAVGRCARPFVVVGLLRLVRSRVRERAVDTLLVAAIVPAALGAFGWIPLVSSLSSRVPGTEGHAWVAVLFLVVDALALAMVGRLFLLFRGRPVADRLLLATFATLLGAHVSRAAAEVTGVVPAPFGSQTLLLVAFGLLAAAASHPSLLPAGGVRPRPPAIGRGHVAFMAVAVSFGPIAVLSRATDAGPWFRFAVGGTAVVSLLVVAHLARLVHDRGRLEHESTHDPLTGLPNRLRFHDLLSRAVIQSAGRNTFAIGFLDLDRFKKVNDSLGHGAGDELLCQVAERLRTDIRQEDVVARLAGDEFGLLLTGVETAAEATDIAQRVLEAFGEEFHVGGQSVFMTPSIGLALYPEHGDEPDTLLRHADAAMYEAKRLGRNTIELYHDQLGVEAHQQLATETRLQIGIGSGELVVYYQPKMSLRTGEVTGVEALVRWDHPTIGLVPPGAFMRLAEETGLVAPIGEHVLHEACRQMQAWRQHDFPDMTVSVNLSLRQFNLQDLVAVVSRALEESGLPAGALELELTESSDLNQAGDVVATLAALRRLGVRCSIDDFGTGYSGIAYLNDLPIDKIKLDKSFIDTIDADGRDAPLVRAMIAMAHSLDLEVIAEGVETKAQLDFLREQGCDTIQGFFFSRPLPPGDLRALLTAEGELHELRPNAVDGERELGEILWAEAQWEAAAAVVAAEMAEEEAEAEAPRLAETVARRTLVLTSVAGVTALPTLLGLTAAAALPPAAQQFVAAAFDRIGATPPRLERPRHGDPGGPVGSGGSHVAGKPVGGQGTGSTAATSGPGGSAGATSPTGGGTPTTTPVGTDISDPGVPVTTGPSQGVTGPGPDVDVPTQRGGNGEPNGNGQGGDHRDDQADAVHGKPTTPPAQRPTAPPSRRPTEPPQAGPNPPAKKTSDPAPAAPTANPGSGKPEKPEPATTGHPKPPAH